MSKSKTKPIDVTYHPIAYPHVTCPKCGAGDPPTTHTRPTRGGGLTVRYHDCYCGRRLKSHEYPRPTG